MKNERNLTIEDPYFDEKGKEIKEFSIIKIYHHKGARGKKYYMYKWVKLVEYKERLVWVALHLLDDSGNYFPLKSVFKQNGRLPGVEVVQTSYIVDGDAFND